MKPTFTIERVYLGDSYRIVACTLYADGKSVATILPLECDLSNLLTALIES